MDPNRFCIEIADQWKVEELEPRRCRDWSWVLLVLAFALAALVPEGLG